MDGVSSRLTYRGLVLGNQTEQVEEVELLCVFASRQQGYESHDVVVDLLLLHGVYLR